MRTIAAPSFFQQAGRVFSNSDNILEGSFWTIWCLFSTSQWREALAEKRKEPNVNLSPAEKAEVVWQTNKKFALASCSFASGISMVVSWLNQVELIVLGRIASVVGAIGFGGSGIVSSVSMYNSFNDFTAQINACLKAGSFKDLRSHVYDAINTVAKTAFFASMAMWGVLGAAFSLLGGAALYLAQDTAFFYCAVTLLSWGSTELISRVAKKYL